MLSLMIIWSAFSYFWVSMLPEAFPQAQEDILFEEFLDGDF